MKAKKHIDDYIFSKLDNAELNGERIGWDKFIGRRRKKRRLIFFAWSIAGLIFLIAGFGISRIYYKTNENLTKLIKNKVNSEPDKANSDSGKKEQNFIKQPEINNKISEKTEKIKEKSPAEKLELNTNEIKDLVIDSVYTPSSYSSTFNNIEIPFRKISFEYNYFSPPDLLTKATEIKEEKKRQGYWFVGFETGLFISDINPVIPLADKDYFHKDYSRIRNEAERNFLGQSFGITFGKQFKNFSVFSGISYNRVSGTGHYNFIYKDAPLLNPDNSIFAYKELAPTDQVTINFQSSQTYTSFGVPIGLGLKLKEKGKNYFGISASFQPTWLINVSGVVPQSVFLNQTTTLNKSGIKLNSSLISLGMNYQYKINSRYLFELNPYFKRNKLYNAEEHSGGTVFKWYGFNGKIIRKF